MLILQRPWNRQPQTAAPVNQGNPLARGLVFHVNLAASDRDLIGPAGVVTDVGTITRGYSAGRFGSTAGIRGASNSGRSITNPSDALRINSGAVTHAGLVRLDSIDSNFGTVFAVSDAAGNATFALQRDGTSNNLYLFRGNSSGVVITGSPIMALADGKQHLFIAISSGHLAGATGTLWIDGVKYTGTAAGSDAGTQAAAGVSLRLLLARTSDTAFSADGDYYQHWTWNRALSDAEALAFTENPQRLYQSRRIWVPVSVASGVTGTFATTLAAATPTASGTTTIVGTVANTLATVTTSFSGTTTVVGSLGNTLVGATLTATGVVGGVSGSFSVSLANATSTANGSPTNVGSLSVALTADVLSAIGTTTILGTLSTTLAEATLSATGFPGTTSPVSTWRTLTNVGP